MPPRQSGSVHAIRLVFPNVEVVTILTEDLTINGVARRVSHRIPALKGNPAKNVGAPSDSLIV